MITTLFSVFRQRWRALLGFALMFRVVESLFFAPLAALVGKWLLGRTVLDSTALVSFLLSPRGFLSLLFAAVMALTLRLLEHGGLSMIFFGAFETRQVSAREALRFLRRNLGTLAGASARFVVLGILAALPLLAVVGGCAAWLLPRHDVNYYLRLRPPEFIAAGVTIGIAALITAGVVFLLVVRWRWVVQVVLFEQRGVRQAFAESAALTRGVRWKVAGLLLGVSLFSLALGLLASVVGSVCASISLAVVGGGAVSLAVAFGLLLLFRTIVGAVFTFLGSCADAGVFTSFYRQCRLAMGGGASLPRVDAVGRRAAARWLPVAVVVVMVVFTATSARLAVGPISAPQPITIHAHRGVSSRAPENTLAAMREAVAAGADYAETDVQLTKDDVLVVAHDSDFSRTGGVAKKVWDLTYEEIRAIPLGSRSAPEFRNESAPTFDALLAETKGKIKVNIELKYYGDHQPGLARKVVEAVRARGMLDRVVVQCLEYEPLLEVRQLAPEVPIGYLLSFNARKPSRLSVDFLSVEQSRLNRAFIGDAHRRGQQVYAWTVDKVEDMQRLFDLGIDAIITNDSALARRTLDEYQALPESERAARRVRSWLED